jgi:predicted nucleic acid-binding protein
MTEPAPLFPLVWLYLDTNLVHYYRIGRAKDSQLVPKLNAIFEHAEQGRVRCTTSPYARFEMINIAKKAEYALQELETGRTDITEILQETRQRFKVVTERMVKRCKDIDRWFDEQRRARRLEIRAAEDPIATWRLAEVLVEQTSITGIGDCMHVATAILLGCSIFVTDDGALLKSIEEELCTGGSSRDAVQAVLLATTGAKNLSIEPLTIHAVHARIERELNSLRAGGGAGAG